MSKQGSTHKVITQYTKDHLHLTAMHIGKATQDTNSVNEICLNLFLVKMNNETLETCM
jgi:hypothetical protein